MALEREFLSDSPRKTKKLGEILAQSLKGGILICLFGDLGGGKTTFAQGFAKGLGVKDKITSPSFVLMKKYSLKKGLLDSFYHFDCYRLKNPGEILALGWEEIIAEPKSVVLVEWAEKIKKYLPKERINIRFEFIDQSRRKIVIM